MNHHILAYNNAGGLIEEFDRTAIYTIDQTGDEFNLAVDGNPIFTGTIVDTLYTITDNINPSPPGITVPPPFAIFPSLTNLGVMMLYDFDPGDYYFTLSDPNTLSGERSSTATGDAWTYGVYSFLPQAAGSPEVSTLTGTRQIAPVPEPATMLLLGAGIAGLAGFRKKFRKA